MIKPRLIALVILSMVCFLTVWEPSAADQTADFRFTILHTNDLHAHDEPFIDRGKNVGGMARIIQLIRSIKAKNPDVVTIDAGDIFQGTPFFKFYHGQVEVQMLNDAGYDIYTIGNHEFDDGPANLAEQLKKAHFTIINSNMDASAVPQLQALIKPSVVKDIEGHKVGFIGAIVPNLTEISLTTGGVKLKATGAQWMDPIKAEIEKVKSLGVDKIILVTHCGLELDKQLATLPDVDVIIGGHSHTRLNEALVFAHPNGSHCIVVQTGSYGRALGKLDLAFKPDGTLDVPQTKYHLINITNKLQSDPKVTAYLEEKAKPFEKMRHNVLATANGDFDQGFRHYSWDSSLGDLVADALVEAGTKYGATISLQNRGGIRARIDKGPITEEIVDEMLPFENHLTVASVPGNVLLKVLENSVSGDTFGGKFLDVHGLKFAYEHEKPPFHRIIWVQAQDKDGNWAELDPKKTYRVAVNDYSFKGGEGYDFAGSSDIHDTGARLSLFMEDYRKKHKTVSPQNPNRIVPISPSLAALSKPTTSPQNDVVVKSSLPGAQVLLVRGEGNDVVTLQGTVVPVPVKNPKIVSRTLIQQGQTEAHLPLRLSGTQQKAGNEIVVVVVPKKHADAAVISEPIVLR